MGVGHTRWATHGKPSHANAHPHMDCTERIAVVHNGIIENYGALRAALIAKGHTFKSETDTEVLSHLIESHYNGDLLAAVRQTLTEVHGAYALGVISSEAPDRLIFARNGASPLIVGLGDGEMFIAYPPVVLLPMVRRSFLTAGSVQVRFNRASRGRPGLHRIWLDACGAIPTVIQRSLPSGD